MTAHRAGAGKLPEDDAEPYAPFCADSLPVRPREVVCELLHFGFPVASNLHTTIAGFCLTQAMFMKCARNLLSHIRQGQSKEAIEEGVARGVLPAVGNYTALEVYNLGKALNNVEVMRSIKERVKVNQKAAAIE